MTRENALALAARFPRLADELDFALDCEAFVGVEGDEVFAGGGFVRDTDGCLRVWIIVPKIGFRRLRWARAEMKKRIDVVTEPLRATVAENDGAGYVFATSLGFTKFIKREGRELVFERAV